jgi:hypothetical protein
MCVLISVRSATTIYQFFLLWGRLDRTVPFALSKQVLQDIPQSEFHALEGVAHVGFYEIRKS